MMGSNDDPLTFWSIVNVEASRGKKGNHTAQSAEGKAPVFPVVVGGILSSCLCKLMAGR